MTTELTIEQQIHKAVRSGNVSDYILYRILELPGCPIKLPKARSMSQAADDLHHLKESIIQWYTSSVTPNKEMK